jgi:hypothetical protein
MSGGIGGTVTLLIALVALVLIMRWVFRPTSRHRRPPLDAAASDELGLLTVAVAALDRSTALRSCSRLHAAGIRSSMSRRRDGRYDVLVFAGDLDRAKALLE